MSILDRYIARQYLINVLALLILLFSFVVMVDVALNLDRFVTTAKRVLRTGGDSDPSAVRVGLYAVFLIIDLWWPRLLQLFSFLIGLILAAAMGFTLTQLVRNRELVAMMASGMSLHRVARPVLIVALVATGVQIVNQEFVLPRIAPLLNREVRDAGVHEWTEFEVRMVADGEGRLFYARRFNPQRQTMTGVHIWERDATGRALRRISADSAVWVSTSAPGAGRGAVGEGMGDWGSAGGATIVPVGMNADGPAPETGYWALENGLAEPFALGQAGAGGGSGPRLTPVATVATDMDPRTLLVKRYSGYSQSLSFLQISEMLRSPLVDDALRERLERIRWGRVSIILSNLLALVITLPFFLTREPKNMVVQSLKCAPVGIIAIMGGVLGASAPIHGLPAGVAVFLPVLILTPIAIATVASLRT